MDHLNLARALVDAARRQGAVIATAESCTGGLLSGAITEAAGASDIFDRGFVTYSNGAKMAQLGVGEETLKAHGAVSEETARQMAEGALGASGATLAVSVTGVAGPGGTEAKPEGMVCFALARPGAQTVSETRRFGPIGRAAVRQCSVEHGLRLLLGALGDPAAST